MYIYIYIYICKYVCVPQAVKFPVSLFLFYTNDITSNVLFLSSMVYTSTCFVVY